MHYPPSPAKARHITPAEQHLHPLHRRAQFFRVPRTLATNSVRRAEPQRIAAERPLPAALGVRDFCTPPAPAHRPGNHGLPPIHAGVPRPVPRKSPLSSAQRTADPCVRTRAPAPITRSGHIVPCGHSAACGQAMSLPALCGPLCAACCLLVPLCVRIVRGLCGPRGVRVRVCLRLGVVRVCL